MCVLIVGFIDLYYSLKGFKFLGKILLIWCQRSDLTDTAIYLFNFTLNTYTFVSTYIFSIIFTHTFPVIRCLHPQGCGGLCTTFICLTSQLYAKCTIYDMNGVRRCIITFHKSKTNIKSINLYLWACSSIISKVCSIRNTTGS